MIVDYLYLPAKGINKFIDRNSVSGTDFEHLLPTVNHAIEIIKAKGFASSTARSTMVTWLSPLAGCPLSLYKQKIAEFVGRALLSKRIQMVIYLNEGLAIIPESLDADKFLLDIMKITREMGLPSLAYQKVQPPPPRSAVGFSA